MCTKCIWRVVCVVAVGLAAGSAVGQPVDEEPNACNKAASSSPAHNATGVSRDVVLSWAPPDGADVYDVYFSPVRKYVEQATADNPVFVDRSLGQEATEYDPGRLEFEQTYYWRVDAVTVVEDVNDPNVVDLVVCPGDVWSFTVEPYSYPVTGPITATASCSNSADEGADNTIDGSGLVADNHSTDPNAMWLSCVVEPVPANPDDPNDPNVIVEPTWIQYEFDKEYQLDKMWVWNWNGSEEPTIGLGAQDVTIEYSPNGSNWTTLGDFTFAQATGSDDYAPNTAVAFGDVAARYVRITFNSSYSGGYQYGLSEVRFFSVPRRATDPMPAVGAMGVPLDGVLTWEPGFAAASHEVYLSADKGAVESGAALVGVAGDASFNLGSVQLDLGQTYYWKVNEVNDAAPVRAVDGVIWSFTAVDYVAVDNFESYANTGALRKSWIDGWVSRTSGGLVRNGEGVLEQTTVHGGGQALKLPYRSSPEPLTEIQLKVKGRTDWTRNGVSKLVLSLHGAPGNINALEPLYLRINSREMKYSGNIVSPWWNQWVIDLGKLDVNVRKNVKTLSIGVGDFAYPFNGPGIVYVDSIRLYWTTPKLNIVNLALQLNSQGAAAGLFDTLLAALVAADPALLEALSSDDTLTVFAPTDEAFEALGLNADNVDELDADILEDILLNHVAQGKLMAADIAAAAAIDTLEGGDLAVKADGVLVDDTGAEATVTVADVEASNGVIHVVDSVLLPYHPIPIAELVVALNEGQFDTVLAAVGAADPAILDALSGDAPLTVFAPTDEAFAALGLDPNTVGELGVDLLTDILLYHVADGKKMAADVLALETIDTLEGGTLLQDAGVLTDDTGGRATIVLTDIEAANGVIHVIDAVVLPYSPSTIAELVATLNEGPDFAGQFDTLLAAVAAADPNVLAALGAPGELTVFAPTDDAFAGLGLDPDNVADVGESVLTDVLLYHVAAGKLMAADVLAAEQIETLEGSVLLQDGGVLTDEIGGQAAITATDVEASNGVIHVIDSVVLPFQLVDLVELLVALNSEGDFAGQFDTLIAAAEAADPSILEALSGTAKLTVLAPTDEAFAALGLTPETIAGVDPGTLTDVLLYHAAAGKLFAKDVLAADAIETLEGSDIAVTPDDPNNLFTDDTGGTAGVVATDLEAANGVVHVIDAVVLPFRLVNLVDLLVSLNSEGDLAGQFDTLLAAAEAADPSILEALVGSDTYTVFAPTDDAFAALGVEPNNVGELDQAYLTDVLLYHVAAGRLMAEDVLALEAITTLQGSDVLQDAGVLTDGRGGQAAITATDLEGTNGVVHVIDAVLMPPEPEPEPEPELANLVDTILALNDEGAYAGQLDTLIAAVLAADPAVVEALSGADEFTVFAPTDDAFAALGLDADNIGDVSQVVLTDILLYHVSAGTLPAADVLAAEQIDMVVNGFVQQADGVLTDNTGGTSNIIETDVQASNGVIHLIDGVLLPAEL